MTRDVVRWFALGLAGVGIALSPFMFRSENAPDVFIEPVPEDTVSDVDAFLAATSTPNTSEILASTTPSDVRVTPLPPVAPAASLTPVVPVDAKQTRATMFWVGESADETNLFIANYASYWDTHWQKQYGGIDAPMVRCAYHPCAFTPRENPFYVALPYGEFHEDGSRKDSARAIPWYGTDDLPLLKNRWVEVRYRDTTCYGQWEDVGPGETDDFAFVFGDAAFPRNTFGERAGIDLSPALFDCLGLSTNADVWWRFVEVEAVPEGPWMDIVTISSGSRSMQY